VVRRSPLAAVAVAVSVSFAIAIAGCASDKAEAPVKLSAAGRRGQALAADQHCTTCHTTDGSRETGPTWKDLAGSTVTLSDGSKVKATDAYLRRSITDPRSQAVKGYVNFMPESFGNLTSKQLADLLAYLHDLSSEDGTPVRH
jgi:cytochrome c1